MQRKGETEMTREEAIRILDPETTGEAISEIEYYGGFTGRKAAVHAVSDACILAVAALREQEQRRWIPVAERLPEKQGKFICTYKFNSNSEMQFVGVLEYYASCQYPHWQHESAGVIVTHWMPMPEPPKESAEG